MAGFGFLDADFCDFADLIAGELGLSKLGLELERLGFEFSEYFEFSEWFLSRGACETFNGVAVDGFLPMGSMLQPPGEVRAPSGTVGLSAEREIEMGDSRERKCVSR